MDLEPTLTSLWWGGGVCGEKGPAETSNLEKLGYFICAISDFWGIIGVPGFALEIGPLLINHIWSWKSQKEEGQ